MGCGATFGRLQSLPLSGPQRPLLKDEGLDLVGPLSPPGLLHTL